MYISMFHTPPRFPVDSKITNSMSSIHRPPYPRSHGSAVAGMHYMKLWTPAQALEWLLVHGLRTPLPVPPAPGSLHSGQIKIADCFLGILLAKISAIFFMPKTITLNFFCFAYLSIHQYALSRRSQNTQVSHSQT